jgi:hypothetical protein
MPVTYPQVLPSTLVYPRSPFRLETGTAGPQRTRGGGVFAVEVADAYWRAGWTSQPLWGVDLLDVQTWWDTLRGGMKSFLAHDPTRPFPRNYASEAAVLALTRGGALGAFNGTFEITFFASVYEMRSVNAVALRPPANFVLSLGDYIGLVQSGRYSLHRVVETVTATSAGNFAIGTGIFVEPPIKTALFSAGATANIIRPLAEFIPEPASWQGEPEIGPSPVSFSAVSKVMT